MLRRFLFKLLWFVPLLVLMGTVNYVSDPALVFHSGDREPRMAAALLRGEELSVTGNFDERKLQLYLVEGMSRPPEEIVLGSSRAMSLTGPELRNHWVSAATLPDLLAIWELYQDRGWQPRRLILVADPWLFNRNYRENRWKSLGTQYHRALVRLGQGGGWSALTDELSFTLARWSELFSPSYFQESLAHLLPISQASPALRRADGSLVYSAQTRAVTAEQVNQDTADYLSRNPMLGLENYNGLDDTLKKTFEDFLVKLQTQGTRVTLVLVPYHPLAYARITAGYKAVGQTESYLRGLGARLGIQVLGSYAPDPQDQFYDWRHPRESTMDRILGRKSPVQSRTVPSTGGSTP